MHTIVIVAAHSPLPVALRHVIEAGSTTVEVEQAGEGPELPHV